MFPLMMWLLFAVPTSLHQQSTSSVSVSNAGGSGPATPARTHHDGVSPSHPLSPTHGAGAGLHIRMPPPERSVHSTFQ